MVGLFRHEDRFIDKNAPEFSVHAQEEVLDEILLHIDVLVEEFAQVLLVDIAPCAHERELEKADHRGRQDELAHAAVVGIDQESLLAEVVEEFFRLGFGCAPELCGFFQGKRPDRELSHPLRLFFREEDAQDLGERLRGRRALREPVEPVFQILVRVS